MDRFEWTVWDGDGGCVECMWMCMMFGCFWWVWVEVGELCRCGFWAGVEGVGRVLGLR